MKNPFRRYNPKKRHDELRRRVERFEQGLTDVAEERRLFADFAKAPTLPPDLEELRPMMLWYASLAPAEEQQSQRRHSFPVWLSAAAVVAVLMTVGISFITGGVMSGDPDLHLYAGSYVMRNGVKDTNLRRILPELKRAERIAAEHSGLLLSGADGAIDMSDPEVAAVINRIQQETYIQP